MGRGVEVLGGSKSYKYNECLPIPSPRFFHDSRGLRTKRGFDTAVRHAACPFRDMKYDLYAGRICDVSLAQHEGLRSKMFISDVPYKIAPNPPSLV